MPGLLAVLALGMVSGADGLGWVHFGDYSLARTIGVVALGLILFEGGLAAGLDEVRPVLRPALALALVGTAITAAIGGFAAQALFDLPLLQGLLIGSIVASTDGAAIFALLRRSTLPARLTRTLEAESGFNDPVAVLLVIALISAITEPGYGFGDALWLLVRQLAIGAAVGLAGGMLAVRAFRAVRLAGPGLYPVASMAVAALSFGAADVLGGSGFLSVYLAGLCLGGAVFPAKQAVSVFHDGLAWIAQLAMFFTLGVLVFPASLGDVAWKGLALALITVVVARPVAVAIATALEPFRFRERVVLGWAGLRGAVPIVLATFPVIEGVPGARELFNLVFFAVIVSTLLQGPSFEPLARALGLVAPAARASAPEPIETLGAQVTEIPVEAGDAAVGRRIRDLRLPPDANATVVVRDGEAIPARGLTRVLAGDVVRVVARSDAGAALGDLRRRWRKGPIEEASARRGPPRSSPSIFSVRSWAERDGDPAHPVRIGEVPVAARIRRRWDEPGVLVSLDDGRYAVTGTRLAVGGRAALQDYARRRAAAARGGDERAWWQEVVAALA